MKISAVIPTYNRADSLQQTLQCLVNQTRPPDETIVVDASTDTTAAERIGKAFPSVIWIYEKPSVCRQRNRGIQAAKGDWILLCDDDIELPDNYIAELERYVREVPQCGAVAGRLQQLSDGNWTDQYPINSFRTLLWVYLFQLPIWGTISEVNTSKLFRPVLTKVRRFYSKRSNHFSRAGWPVITNWQEPVFTTTLYSLGANLIKKDWLLQTPYDEVLDPNGIGDNFGVALGFPAPVHVITSTYARHHKLGSNRLEEGIVYFRRVLALHYFIKRSGKFPKSTAAFLAWSLFGSLIGFLFRGDLKKARAARSALLIILFGNNPYLEGAKHGETSVQPTY